MDEFDERLRLLAFDDSARQDLREFWPSVERHLPHLLEIFYRRVGEIPQLAVKLGGQTERLREQQTDHWRKLFSANFQEDYFRSASTIGLVHNRIGLDPFWYIAGYGHFLIELTALAQQPAPWYRALFGSLVPPSSMTGPSMPVARRPRPKRRNHRAASIVKALLIDIGVAVLAYQQALLRDRSQRQQILEQAINEFDREMVDILASLQSSSQKIDITAHELTGNSATTSQRVADIATASTAAAGDVEMTAAATEQLTAAIGEISRQMSESTQITGRAMTAMETADSLSRILQDAAGRIGSVLDLINRLAAQTNLLALNATIEAARAGAAGKGFTVVASEVKGLATQTASATGEIETQVTAIQTATRQSAGALQELDDVVRQLQSVMIGIGTAIDEQNAATQEIARNVQQAASHSQRIAGNMDELSDVAGRNANAAGAMRQTATELRERTIRLEQRFRHFRDSVRESQ